jgi:ABC-type antimicrobial peptide transport system permease subunit
VVLDVVIVTTLMGFTAAALPLWRVIRINPLAALKYQ